MRFAIVEIQSERICDKVDSDVDLHQAIVASAGAPNEQRYLRIPDGADENHLVILEAEDGSKYIEVDTQAKIEEQWSSLRQERDRRLSSCDWTQIPDSPLSTQAKADWATYRQALRDLPAVTSDPAVPAWPTQPA